MQDAVATADNGRRRSLKYAVGSRIFRTVGVFTAGSSHCSSNSLVQFHIAALIAVSKHRQISSLKASRQLTETTADNAMDFLYYNRNNRKKAHIYSAIERFSHPPEVLPHNRLIQNLLGNSVLPQQQLKPDKNNREPGENCFTRVMYLVQGKVTVRWERQPGVNAHG